MKRRDGRSNQSRQFSVTADEEIIKKLKKYCIDNDIPVWKAFEIAATMYLESPAKKMEVKKLATTPQVDSNRAVNVVHDVLDVINGR